MGFYAPDAGVRPVRILNGWLKDIEATANIVTDEQLHHITHISCSVSEIRDLMISVIVDGGVSEPRIWEHFSQVRGLASLEVDGIWVACGEGL